MVNTTQAATAKITSQANRARRPSNASRISVSARRPTVQISMVSVPSSALTAYSPSATCVISFAFGRTGATWVASRTASSGSTTASTPMNEENWSPARSVKSR
ncbi:hypothetical protein B0E54_02880 [Micromonospora sp. MH99]|nr:hypothetical protein [Micromonospora sp. MH99]